MKRKICLFLVLVISLLFASCTDKEKKETSAASTVASSVAITKEVKVTDKSGKVVTDASGEAATETVEVKKIEKEVTVAVTDKSGETVTNKSGEAVTEKRTVTEYVTMPISKASENTKSSTTKKLTTAQITTTKAVTTLPPTTKPITTTTAPPIKKLTAADLPKRELLEVESEMFRLTNEARAKESERRVANGLQPLTQLTWDNDLYGVAIIRSEEWSRDTTKAHNRPDGRSYTSLWSDYNIMDNYGCMGENLVCSNAKNPEYLHQCLMNSSGHKDNILRASFANVGIAAFYGADGYIYVAEEFGHYWE